MFKLYRDFETQAQIDEQYKPLPTTEGMIAARQRALSLSEKARGKLRHSLKVPYGPTRPEYLDIFPAGTEGAPVFVFLHGGYWRALTSEDYSFVALGPVSRDVLTVSVNYALAPRVGIDEIVRQARAAIAWVMRNIQDHGGDPTRIVVGGHSAGGQLAAMCALTDWAGDYGLDPGQIRGALLISGLFDLAPLRYSFLQPQLQFDEGDVLRNSPFNFAIDFNVPAMLAVGERESDEFHRQSLDFQAACSRLPAQEVVFDSISGADHFTAVEPLLDGESRMCEWLLNRLQS